MTGTDVLTHFSYTIPSWVLFIKVSMDNVLFVEGRYLAKMVLVLETSLAESDKKFSLSWFS